MTVTEVHQSLGSWELRLREDTPNHIRKAITYFGHVAVMPGQFDPTQYGDNLLSKARFIGVLRDRGLRDDLLIGGSGLAFWLGDEDDKGDIHETPVVLTSQTFANSINALLPPGGGVASGTVHSVAGTYTGKHQWQTPRKALTYVTDTFGAEWRIRGDVTNKVVLDAGTVAQLYVTTPTALVMSKDYGQDMFRAALPGRAQLDTSVADLTTRVVLLAEGEGDSITTGDADAPASPYKDLRGNTVKLTRLVSESQTDTTNADARAQLQLNRFTGLRKSVNLSTFDYDVKGQFVVGDYVDVYDPINGFEDVAREIYWRGLPINPVALRCVEMTWPIPQGWTVAFRDINGVWIDLSPWYEPEGGETQIVVGALSRSLTQIGGEPVGIRPNLPDSPGADTTIPAAPAFTGFSTGVYESDNRTLSSIQATWAQPLNLDGSTITDGDHYEIRYRPNAIIGTDVSWDYLSGGYNVDFEDPFSIDYPSSFGPNWASGSDLEVSTGQAKISHPSFNSIRSSWYSGLSCVNVEVVACHRIDYLPLGASTVMGMAMRWVSSGNLYWVRVEPNVDLSVTAKITKYKGGVFSELAAIDIPGMVHSSGVQYWTKGTIYGDVITLKVWRGELTDEPQSDTLSVWDQDPVSGVGDVGIMDYIVGGSVNTLGSQTKHPHFRMRNLAPDNLGNAYSWDDLGTWDAITSPPVSITPTWSLVYSGWDQTSYTLVELSPGVQYEFQIRAVDAAIPPHQGPWSTSSYVQTTGDVIAPDTPAAPHTVAASMIGVQVEHWLGKSSGGNFNLQLDLAFLEVHASHTPSFTPDVGTKIGDMIATGAMIRGNIPALGSFKVDQAASVWIRVVAVDRSGNKSGPSDAVQSNVELIDDAHISNLSVTKLTAGTITAQMVLASQMVVAGSGNIKLTSGSLDVYNNAGEKTVEAGLLADGTYDLASINPNNGALVAISTMAHGLTANSASGTFAATSGTPTVGIPGAAVTVKIGNAGRALLLISASFSMDIGEWGSVGVAGYRPGKTFPQPTDYDSAIAPSFGNMLTVSSGTLGGTAIASLGVVDLAEGLAKDTWTFYPYMSRTAGTSPTCTQVYLAVLPY